MNPTIVRNFCNYTPEQLAQTKEKLGLRMSVETLARCASYYRTFEKKRDPYLKELLMLDMLASQPADLVSVRISALSSNDPFAAQTYADMMEKRNELHPEAKTPITVGEALGMATAYLKRSGKKPALPSGTQCRLRRFSDVSRFPESPMISVDGSRFLLELHPEKEPETEPGDLYVLLDQDGSTTPEEYRMAVEKCFADPEVCGKIKRSFPVPHTGLLPLFLSMHTGICYDLRKFSAERSGFSFSALLYRFAGLCVISVPKDEVRTVTETIGKAGLRPLVIAAAVEGNRSFFTIAQNRVISLDNAFLNSLRPVATSEALLPDEADVRTDHISHCPVSRSNIPYLSGSAGNTDRIDLRGNVVTSAFCKTGISFFRSAVQTALTALLSLAVSGTDYGDARLALALTVPGCGTPQTLGETVAVILGLYRVQTELGIPAAAITLRESRETEHPELTVYAIGAGKALPSCNIAAMNHIYCVSPATSDSGLPDFRALRSMLAELAQRSARGEFAGARVMSGGSMTDLLGKTSGNALTVRISDPIAMEGDPLKLAALIESREQLPFGQAGMVVPSGTTGDPHASLPDLPSETLTSCGKYTVTLLSAPDDTGAYMLDAFLRTNGAECRCFSTGSEEAGIAHSVLSSQLFLICGSEKLPEGDRMRFALQTLCSSGGLAFRLGAPQQPSDPSVILSAENGLPLENLLSALRKTD